MPPLMTPARLPDELIMEVFKSGLDIWDLFNCSLVSRKFVEGVNLLLYNRISITVYQGQSQRAEEDDDLARCEYSAETWELLRSLMDHSKLRQLVESIEFVSYSLFLRNEPDEPVLETTPRIALSTLLRLCRNVKKVEFVDVWRISTVELKVIKQLIVIEDLSMRGVRVEDAEFISKQLPQLKRFHASTFPDPFPSSLHLPQTVTYPSNLRSLSLLSGPFQFHRALVSANYSTLQQLSISVDVARRLDYEQLTQLRTLELEDTDGPTQQPSYTVGVEFWTSLSKSPSLRCLVLSGDRYSDGYEAILFGPNKVCFYTSIPTLKTIRFGDGVYLDRVNLLLSGPIGATLHQVVVSEYFVDKDRDVFTKNTFSFLSGICH